MGDVIVKVTRQPVIVNVNAFRGINRIYTDGSFGGDGTVNNPLSTIGCAVYADGTTITGDGTQLNPLVAVGGVGGGTWGSITGTLSNQTDLQSALNAKLADSDAGVGARINASASATPNDTDLVATAENAGLLKKITWTSVKAFLKTYFDTIYQTILVSGTSIKTINFTSLLGAGDISITPNATHTGEVTGATTLTVDKTAITNKTAVTIDTADYVLISDTSDSGNLKKGLVSDLGGFDDGDFTLVASFKSLYNY